jgi:hypothetical protein
MARLFGMNIQKGERLSVLVDLVRRYLSLNNFRENTILHGFYCTGTGQGRLNKY